jgi:hypothetical protein
MEWMANEELYGMNVTRKYEKHDMKLILNEIMENVTEYV